MLKLGLSSIWVVPDIDQKTDLPTHEVKECLVDFQILFQVLYWAAFQKTSKTNDDDNESSHHLFS